MERRKFGRTNEAVSVIGMGTYYGTMGGPTSFGVRSKGFDEKVAALKKGIELGMNLIDTAEVYGTEILVAAATQGVPRDDLFIATKVSATHLRYEDVLKAAAGSLERLKTGYIDLYQIHWPNPSVPIKETMRAFEKLVDEGKVRYVGVSNFSRRETEEASEAMAKHELVCNQVEYSLLEREIEGDLLPYLERNVIAVLAYRPLANGSLSRPERRLRSAMDSVSKAHDGKTYSQIALNWLRSKGRFVFPIPRMSSPVRAEEDAGAAGWDLKPEEVSYLERSL